MKLPQMLMDFPYEEPELGNGKRRRWMVGAVLFLAIGLLGILGFMDELRAFSVIALSDGPKLTIAAAQVLLGLFGLFSLGCYLAWRKGKSVRVVYRRGQAVILALALAALAWLGVTAVAGRREPMPPVSDHYTYQSSPLAAIAWGGDEGYWYQIVDVKAPFVYDLCLDMYTDGRHNTSSEWEPWPQILGATALYGESRERNWLALWEDRIVWVSFDQPPEAKKLMGVLEQLNAWERDSA